MNKKVLIVAVYPIKNAQHGGQKRVRAVVDAYKNVFQDVRFVSIFPPDYYQQYGRYDIAVKGKTRQATTDSPYTGDITCGLAIFDDPRVKKKFKTLLQKFKPDIIQCEQVFPYMGIKPLLAEMGLSPKLILSSQNIEYTQKLDILRISGYGHEAEDAAKFIKGWESDFAKHADLTVAVSQGDADELKALGGANVVLAPNGIARHHLTESAKQHWKDYKRENKVNKLAVFVGSAHPPNWHGFLDMVGDRVGFMPPDSKLVLAGSISDYFHDTFKDIRPEHVTFWKRVISAGRLSDTLLAGLLDECDVVLLPITEGGGSNLKTAEAILSGKKIVATTYAFRSFEQYVDLPNIYIADTPEAFRSAILKAFEAPYVERTKEQQELAETVQWQYCLRPMIDGAKAL